MQNDLAYSLRLESSKSDFWFKAHWLSAVTRKKLWVTIPLSNYLPPKIMY